MQKKRVEILITNDDGYRAKGIKTAIDIFSKYGNVTAVAPRNHQSGKSASLTMGEPLWLKKIFEKRHSNGNTVKFFSFSGSPADCVKMAMNKFFSVQNKPDLLVAGINHGSNASAAAVYSGTLGAAKEGTIYGIPSIALSLNDHKEDADFSPIKKNIGAIMNNFFKNPPVPGVFLNINFPAIPPEKIKGIKIAAQGRGMWLDELNLYNDPYGKEYYWMSGEFHSTEERDFGDHKVVDDGYISIVPHKVDTTDYPERERLMKLWHFKKRK